MARSVQVVLTEDLPNVGQSGEVVRVRPGYARNFLIPRGLAAVATKDNVGRIEHEKRVAQLRAQKVRAESQELAKKLHGTKIKVGVQVGEENKIYGSVTSRDVEEGLAAKGFEVDRRKIVMDPLKELGVHDVAVRIAAGVDATVQVEVVPKA